MIGAAAMYAILLLFTGVLGGHGAVEQGYPIVPMLRLEFQLLRGAC